MDLGDQAAMLAWKVLVALLGQMNQVDWVDLVNLIDMVNPVGPGRHGRLGGPWDQNVENYRNVRFLHYTHFVTMFCCSSSKLINFKMHFHKYVHKVHFCEQCECVVQLTKKNEHSANKMGKNIFYRKKLLFEQIISHVTVVVEIHPFFLMTSCSLLGIEGTRTFRYSQSTSQCSPQD